MPWRGPQYDGEFPSLGWQIVDWIEHYLCHGPGDVAGEPIELDDEFVEFFVKAYRIDPDTGRRMYRRAFLSRPKGRAKSELAGMIGCAEARGPVRFGGWDAAGEPVGRPVKSPFIRCLATEEGQSGNTYDNITMMMDHLSTNFGDEYPGIDLGQSTQTSSRVFFAGGGEIRPSSASDAAKDGGKESFVVFDETHLLILPVHKRMHSTVRRNLRKRKAAEPWALETSTMYQVGQGSVAEETHQYAQAIAQGKVREKGLLFDHKQADDIDLTDRDSMLEGLNFVYGPFAQHMDLDGIIAEIWDPQSNPSDSRRFWFNCPTSADDALFAAYEWASCLDTDKVIADKDAVTLGFDGSRGRVRGKPDATALIGCRVADGHLFEIGVWEATEGPHMEDWTPPIPEIEAAVANAFRTWNVVGFYADPARDWRSHVNKWEADFGGKIEKKMRVKPDHPFEWWMTGGRSGLIQLAVEAFEGAVRNQDLTHDGSFKLTQHILNSRREIRSGKLRIGKENDYSPKKVDAAVAAVLAWQARCDAVAAGVNGRRRSRKLTRY